MNSNIKPELTSFLWPGLAVILAVLLVFVSYQNIQLKKQLANTNPEVKSPDDYPTAREGEKAPPLEVYDAYGNLKNLLPDTTHTPLILGWYSDECDVCYFSKDGWNRLIAEYPDRVWALKKAYDFEPDTLFFGETVDFPLLFPVDPEVYELYHINITPQTMLIDKDGIIARVWRGVLDPRMVTEIKSQMNQLLERR